MNYDFLEIVDTGLYDDVYKDIQLNTSKFTDSEYNDIDDTILSINSNGMFLRYVYYKGTIPSMVYSLSEYRPKNDILDEYIITNKIKAINIKLFKVSDNYVYVTIQADRKKSHDCRLLYLKLDCSYYNLGESIRTIYNNLNYIVDDLIQMHPYPYIDIYMGDLFGGDLNVISNLDDDE